MNRIDYRIKQVPKSAKWSKDHDRRGLLLWKWVLFLQLLACVSSAGGLNTSKRLKQYARTSWSSVDGLPVDSVQTILQTRDQYIWLGTSKGLVRFNGVRFTVFDKANSSELKHDNVTVLLEDRKDEALWIGTFGGGLARYTAGVFQSYSEEIGKFVLALAQDRHGTLWIGTDKGLAEFKDGKLTPRLEITEEIISLAIAPDEVVWATTAHDVYRVSRVVEKLHFPVHDPKSLYFDHEGSAWIGTATHGLYTFRNNKLTHYESGPQLHTVATTALYEDRARNLWIGNSAGGLCRLQSQDFDCLELNDSNKIQSIYEDHEGNLWVGSQTGGLNRLRDVSFTSYDHKMGVADDLVWGVFQSRDKSIWIATNNGLSVLRNGKIQTLKLGPNHPDNTVFVTAEDADGTLMAGTENGVKVIRNGRVIRSYTVKDGLASNTAHALYRDREGAWWIGDRDLGLTRFKDGKFTIITPKNGRPYRVRVVFQDHEGSIWFGTEEGLAQLKSGAFQNFDNPPVFAGGVTTIYEDSEHAMWFGTFGSGLVRYKDGQFTTYRVKDGLFDDTVWSLLEDRKGNFWMSCDRGLFRTSKADLNDFAARKIQRFHSRAFGLTDDLPTTDFNGGTQATGWKTFDGKLLFATGKGVVDLDPENLAPNLVPPQVLIETVSLNGRQFNQPQAPVGQGELDFHFAALSFAAPEMVDFQYRLDPFDPDWKEVKGKLDAHYTNMVPGKYRFHVKAANPDGVWNVEGASFSFELEPLFYQTTLFRSLCGLGLVMVGLGINVARNRRIRATEIRLIALVEERTKELQEANKQKQEAYEQVRLMNEQLRLANEELQREKEAARAASEARRSLRPP